MLFTSELLRIIRHHLPQLSWYFDGVFPLNNLPYLNLWHQPDRHRRRRPLGLIVNTDTSDLPGKHWIACLLHGDGRGECFDSFGQLPPPRVQFWMNKHCPRGWNYNTQMLQSPLSTLCGAYCLYFLYNRIVCGDPFDTIISKLSSASNSDNVVLAFLNNALRRK